MSTRNLKALFRPQSIAVIGASTAPKSIGALVMRNLLKAEFAGPVMPVTPEHPSVAENKAAWKVLEAFDKPFLTAFSDSDPVSKGGDVPFQQRVPGAYVETGCELTDALHLQVRCGRYIAQVSYIKIQFFSAKMLCQVPGVVDFHPDVHTRKAGSHFGK